MLEELDKDKNLREDLWNKIKQTIENDNIHSLTTKDKVLFFLFINILI